MKGYLFWPPFLKVFCQKWKFGRAKEMSASAGIWTWVPRSKGSYAIQWATLLLIENQQKLASYNNFCFGSFLTKNFQKGNGQNRYIFELLTLSTVSITQFFGWKLAVYHTTLCLVAGKAPLRRVDSSYYCFLRQEVNFSWLTI